MNDVFISYVQGQKIAEIMKEALEKRGLSVFIDKNLAMGASLVFSLNRAMKESRSYLLIIDKEFVTKQWTNLEVQAAFLEAMKQKKIFPLLVNEDAKKFWIEENPLFANFIGRVWGESSPEALAEEIMSIMKKAKTTYC